MPKCDHSDTRLSCTDCEQPVCPKCMVQCAVGNRCKKCAGRFESHLEKVTPLVVTKVVCASIAAGFALAFINQMSSRFFILQFLIVGFAAMFLGKLIHRVSGYKLGRKIAPYVAISVFLGLLTDHREFHIVLFSLKSLNLTAIAHALFLPALAVLMVLVPIFQDVDTR